MAKKWQMDLDKIHLDKAVKASHLMLVEKLLEEMTNNKINFKSVEVDAEYGRQQIPESIMRTNLSLKNLSKVYFDVEVSKNNSLEVNQLALKIASILGVHKITTNKDDPLNFKITADKGNLQKVIDKAKDMHNH